MTSISAIRDGVKTRLETIAGLRVHDTVPGQVSPPAAVVAPAPGTFLTYNVTTDGAEDVTLVVTLLVSDAVDRAAQDALDAYLADSGASSVKAAVDGGITLGGAAHFATVTSARNYGLIDYGGVQYLGCEFVVTVGAL